MNQPRALVTAASVASLTFFQVALVAVLWTTNPFGQLTLVEAAVLLLQAAKLPAFLFFRSLRNATTAETINAMGAELIVYEAVSLTYIATSVPVLYSVSNQIFLSWILGTAIFGVPLAIFKLGRAMASGSAAISVLPSVVLLAQVQLAFLAASGRQAAQQGTALGFGTSLVSLENSQQGVATVALPVDIVLTCLVSIYVSLLLYSTFILNGGVRSKINSSLTLSLGATMFAGAWGFFLYPTMPSISVIMLVPVLSFAGASWWLVRGS